MADIVASLDSGLTADSERPGCPIAAKTRVNGASRQVDGQTLGTSVAMKQVAHPSNARKMRARHGPTSALTIDMIARICGASRLA